MATKHHDILMFPFCLPIICITHIKLLQQEILSEASRFFGFGQSDLGLVVLPSSAYMASPSELTLLPKDAIKRKVGKHLY